MKQTSVFALLLLTGIVSCAVQKPLLERQTIIKDSFLAPADDSYTIQDLLSPYIDIIEGGCPEEPAAPLPMRGL